MKKILLATLLLLTGCNYQAVDFNYYYTKVHLYQTNKCYNIESWRDYEGEQLQVNIEGKGKILISANSCFLVVDKCPICN